MKTAVFSFHGFEKPAFENLQKKFGHELVFFEHQLTLETAVLARGFPVVSAFVGDRLDKAVLGLLRDGGTRLIALRSAGFNHVDLKAAAELGMRVARVPAYSPHAIAEHAVTLIQALNRKICRAHARVHDLNFSLEGLVGFDLYQKTVGVIGTGRIGSVFARIMSGFGCRVLASDLQVDVDLRDRFGVRYVQLEKIFRESDIISLHVPLNPQTRHLLDARAFAMMKPGVMVINTGRGALIETKALIQALKTRHVGAAGLDVYEEEESVFFHDLSDQVLQDDVLARLLTFPNVLITSHQAFLTQEALGQIAMTTLQNISDFADGKPLANEVKA